MGLEDFYNYAFGGLWGGWARETQEISNLKSKIILLIQQVEVAIDDAFKNKLISENGALKLKLKEIKREWAEISRAWEGWSQSKAESVHREFYQKLRFFSEEIEKALKVRIADPELIVKTSWYQGIANKVLIVIAVLIAFWIIYKGFLWYLGQK